MSDPPLKVLIADDHPVILEGIRRGLERSENIEVVGEAHSVRAAMSLIEHRHPELVLLDLRLPDVESTKHIEQVCTTWPEVKVVVLSESEDRPSIDAALRAGARAFVMKNIATSDLAPVLLQVARGTALRAIGQ